LKGIKTASPREEALTYASNARNAILENKQNPVSALRSCLVIASILNKNDEKKWIIQELRGYSESEEVPDYRNIHWHVIDQFGNFECFEINMVVYGAHHMQNSLERKEHIYFCRDGKKILLFIAEINRILSAIVDRCLFFLNEIIEELQYGGIVEYLMEEIRKNTDEKLAKLDKRIVDEAHSLFINLTSNNPADWSKVGHSSRRMFQLLADGVFEPRNELYKMKDDRELKVGTSQFVNRLCAFLDQKVSGRERRFVISELEYFESYLHQVTKYVQMGEHNNSIEKYHANMLAIHTYLIISEILKHKE